MRNENPTFIISDTFLWGALLEKRKGRHTTSKKKEEEEQKIS